MHSLKISLLVGFFICFLGFCSCFAVGITPEQIYQQNMDWGAILGTWEKLPEVNPLSEKPHRTFEPEFRALMTLRKDGTCRVFNAENPSGIDGIWVCENHNMFITLPGAGRLEFFVYGIKSDFMVTRSPLNEGIDQLWSRVK